MVPAACERSRVYERVRYVSKVHYKPIVGDSSKQAAGWKLGDIRDRCLKCDSVHQTKVASGSKPSDEHLGLLMNGTHVASKLSLTAQYVLFKGRIREPQPATAGNLHRNGRLNTHQRLLPEFGR